MSMVMTTSAPRTKAPPQPVTVADEQDPFRTGGRLVLERVRYRTVGEGPPLLLLNGLFQSIGSWDPVVTALTDTFRLTCLDLPNQGPRASHPSYRRFDQYCAFVRDFVAAAGLDPRRTAVFGFSFGGEIARTLQFEQGLRFRHLVLGSVSPPGLGQFWRSFFDNMLALAGRADLENFVRAVGFQMYSPRHFQRLPKLLHLMYLKYGEYFDGAAESLCCLIEAARSRDFNSVRYLVNNPGRVDIITPTHDNLVPFGLSRDYAATLGAGFHEIEAGHTFPIENPAETAAMLRRILAPHTS